jgi:hypothetical protein
MPAPITLAPYAWTALRLGAVAAVTLYAARSRASQPKDPHVERVLDAMPEGAVASPHRAEGESGVNGEGRFRRTVRLGPNGPAFEVDAAALGRVRVRRVD